jgi:hypothetical protein
MAPQEICRLKNLLNSYQTEKILMEQQFERRKEPLYQALQAAARNEEPTQVTRNLINQLGNIVDEERREIERINQKIEETKRDLNRHHYL